jgi:hypothetical protein
MGASGVKARCHVATHGRIVLAQKPVPSGDASTAARGQGLKRCHQARDRRVSASSSGQGPRAPRANSAADKVATPADKVNGGRC